MPLDHINQNLTPTTPRTVPYFKSIIENKVAGAALTCFETIVHWLLTTCSCFYPAYNRFYEYQKRVATARNDQQVEQETSQPFAGSDNQPMGLLRPATSEQRTSMTAQQILPQTTSPEDLDILSGAQEEEEEEEEEPANLGTTPSVQQPTQDIFEQEPQVPTLENCPSSTQEPVFPKEVTVTAEELEAKPINQMQQLLFAKQAENAQEHAVTGQETVTAGGLLGALQQADETPLILPLEAFSLAEAVRKDLRSRPLDLVVKLFYTEPDEEMSFIYQEAILEKLPTYKLSAILELFEETVLLPWTSVEPDEANAKCIENLLKAELCKRMGGNDPFDSQEAAQALYEALIQELQQKHLSTNTWRLKWQAIPYKFQPYSFRSAALLKIIYEKDKNDIEELMDTIELITTVDEQGVLKRTNRVPVLETAPAEEMKKRVAELNQGRDPYDDTDPQASLEVLLKLKEERNW